MAGSHQANHGFTGSSMADKMFADAGAYGFEKEQHDASHSLWQSVYENPGTTAMVVGGAVIAAGALVASRGALGRLLPGAKNEVLLFEDSPYFGKAIKTTLEEQGNRVTWLTGAEDVKALKAGVATAPDGHAVPVHLERFKAAFVDGDLKGKVTGTDVVDQLTAEHISSIGISSQVAMNTEMLEHGAIAAGLKPTVFGAIVNKDVTVAGILEKPGMVQGAIDSYQKRYLADHKIGDRAGTLLKAAMEKMGIG